MLPDDVKPVPPFAMLIAVPLQTPDVIFPAILISELNVAVLLNVFAPPMVCVPEVIKPGFVTSAAVNVKVVPLKVPPFVLAVEV